MFGLEIGDAEVLRNAGGRVTLDMIRSVNKPADFGASSATTIHIHICCIHVAYVVHASLFVSPLACRSLVVSQEILKTTDIFVIHHTDCGGQAAVRQHGMLIQSMVDKLPLPFGLLLRLLDFLQMTGLILKPIRNLERSIIEDVEKLKANPLVPQSIGIYGFLYSTEDGSLKEVTRRLPNRSGKKLQ